MSTLHTTPMPIYDLELARQHALQFLCQVVEGKALIQPVLTASDDYIISYPTLDQRLKVATLIVRKDEILATIAENKPDTPEAFGIKELRRKLATRFMGTQFGPDMLEVKKVSKV